MTTPSVLVECGVAQVAHPDQIEPGDGYLVEPFPGGMLISVVDGLGHGPKAAYATKTALEVLKPHPQEEPLSLMKRCHQAMSRTRGAVISIASLDARQNVVRWVGVGNVTGVLVRNTDTTDINREYLHLRGGIIGYRLPNLRVFEVKIDVGDLLIFVTDGVRSSFMESCRCGLSAQKIADRILDRHNRGTDDALVLVVRYLGLNGVTVENAGQDNHKNGQ
jgi:negative regulator of sigma-B (phosphoserine phosphatase)